MAKEEAIELEGKILDSLPNAQFKVQIIENQPEDGEPYIILGHVSGNIRRNFVKILPGDLVTVAISPYDLTKGRIIYRK